ncbi:hypothetical protein [Sphingomonas aracearum]|uniref:XRE family transcriptional regulator n=1 Tax=Sphingomonas aracearum TaxID=2283317 RepID=A0A369VVV4_9SPHN|nr:hypothetical protein [Sphingomonas aracearum]RDE06526.1 hypothetical protein DVW87_02110 [Sphingomonas aracearum]
MTAPPRARLVITADMARKNLGAIAAERGITLTSLSALLGRSAAYMQQYVQRGSPKWLDPDDRLLLAKHLQVDERLLGARDPWTPGEG